MTNQFRSSTKNLGLVLHFFKTSLELPLFACGFAWFTLVVTTALVCTVPHQDNFVQKWWFYGSVHLVLVTALTLGLFTKNLTQAAGTQCVPGWRRAHLQGLVVCLASLVAVAVLIGVIWAWIANEPLDATLLPWLLFAASFAVCVSYVSPLRQAGFKKISAPVAWILFAEAVIVTSQDSKNFPIVWPVWMVLRDFPWLLALGSSLAAVALYAQPSPKRSFTSRVPSWATIKAARERLLESPGKRLRGRHWPLLKLSRVSGSEMTAWIIVLPQLSTAVNTPLNSQISFYWIYSVCLCSMLGADTKLARQAGMLMLLPRGLSRHTLGKDLFYRLVLKHATMLLLLTLAFGAVQLFTDKSFGFLFEPTVLLLAAGYGVFSAGWIAAFLREKLNKFLRVIVLGLPAFVLGFSLMITQANHKGQAVLTEPTQLGLALLFAVTGWYLGRNHTAHWGLQDFNNLLKTSKPLA